MRALVAYRTAALAGYLDVCLDCGVATPSYKLLPRSAMPPAEFIRRFLLHVLPSGFRKIRHHGLLAPANVNTRHLVAKTLLRRVDPSRETPVYEPREWLGEPVEAARPVPCCPVCGSLNRRREEIPRPARGPP